MITAQAEPAPPAPNLLLPARPPRALAIYAFRGARTTAPGMSSAIPSALAACGIGVLALDLRSAPSSPITTSQDADLLALRQAADALRSEHGEPSLLIGHSAAGPAVLSAAAALPEVRAVVTVGSPAPRRRRLSTVPLLVLHAPDDHVVPAREANRVFAAALHPRSFIALDGADHDVSEPHHARRVAGLVAAWAEPYLPEHAASPPPLDPSVSLVVTDAGTYMSFSSEVFPGGGECANESTRNFLKSYMAEFRDHVVRVLTVLPRQQ